MAGNVPVVDNYYHCGTLGGGNEVCAGKVLLTS